jgi:hypothetical protein
MCEYLDINGLTNDLFLNMVYIIHILCNMDTMYMCNTALSRYVNPAYIKEDHCKEKR